MTLTECADNIGAAVVYTPPGCETHCCRADHGVITAVNAMFAFVRYGDEEHSKATMPANLTLTAEVDRG